MFPALFVALGAWAILLVGPAFMSVLLARLAR